MRGGAVSLVDMAPTRSSISSASRRRLPSTDGRSSIPVPRRALLHRLLAGPPRGPRRDWKCIVEVESGRTRLYDLRADPHERERPVAAVPGGSRGVPEDAPRLDRLPAVDDRGPRDRRSGGRGIRRV